MPKSKKPARTARARTRFAETKPRRPDLSREQGRRTSRRPQIAAQRQRFLPGKGGHR